ncbi:MAG: hypothetical protein QOI09_2191, partial [Chloroflexota bacterium]|nr:hypothetical protein [Chloroflexota bacterium]
GTIAATGTTVGDLIALDLPEH